jgi:type II secretory pathway component PulF
MADEPIKLVYQQPRLAAEPAWKGGPVSPFRQVTKWVVSNAFWLTMAGIAIGVPTGAAYFVSGPTLSFPALVVIVVLVPTIAFAAERVRRRRLIAVLGYLQQAMRLNLPLNRLLAAAARGEHGPVRRELFIIQSSLESGAPLSAALKMAFPSTGQRSAGLIDYAEQIGAVPRTIDRLIRERLGESRAVGDNRSMMIWYPPLLLLVAGAVVGFACIFALPKLVGIFQANHIGLPLITRSMLRIQDWIAIPLLAMALLLWCVWATRLRETMRPRRQTRFLRTPLDRMLWFIPLYGSVLRERAMADLCTAIADAVELGFPLDQALARTDGIELNSMMRRRVQLWNLGMSKGLLPDEAARQARLPRFFIGMLAASRSGSELSEVLRYVARFYRDRFLLRRELLRGAYLPAVTLIMGVIVAGVALGLFLPLARLIATMGTAVRGGL